MPKYPITLSVSSSSKKRKLPYFVLREYATQIEGYINDISQKEHVREFNYDEIASDLGINKNIVKDFLSPIGGGSHGITVHYPNVGENG